MGTKYLQLSTTANSLLSNLHACYLVLLCISLLFLSLPAQVAAWQLLSSIMQRYLHTHSSSGSSSSWGTSYSQAWQQEAAAAWRQLELQVAPSKDASTVSG